MGSRTRLGALAWLSAVQFFLAQVVVASGWTTPFSLTTQVISDLGNTACGPYPHASSAVVCSPWHAGMNASFIMVGITMVAGAILARGAFLPGWRRILAVVLFATAGLGVLMVGIFPENENITYHSIGAGINFIGGNLSLILFGLSVPRIPSRPGFVPFSVTAGLAGLVATMLFVTRHDLGLGLGGMERVAAYTTTLWQIVAGLLLLRTPGAR